LFDWSQNDEHKTTICVYSLRAKEEPTVQLPSTWDEVQNCLKKKETGLLKFRSEKVLARVENLAISSNGRRTQTETAQEMEAMTYTNNSKIIEHEQLRVV